MRDTSAENGVKKLCSIWTGTLVGGKVGTSGNVGKPGIGSKVPCAPVESASRLA